MIRGAVGPERWWRGAAGWWFAACVLAVCLSASLETAAAPVREPLRLEGNAEFYQRVLTLDGAVLRKSPDAGAAAMGGPLRVFSILYVFDRRAVGDKAWVEVAGKLTGEGAGWVEEDLTQRWDVMLTMEYAPAGQRDRVLFFNRSDDLVQLVRDPQGPAKARDLERQVEAGTHDHGLIVAQEEAPRQGGVSTQARPYVMPILAFKPEEFDNGAPTTLVEVASVPARAAPPPTPAPTPAITDGVNRVGVAFVVDTTKSMGPYIERVRAAIRHVYDALGSRGLNGRTTVAVVGYRNNTKLRPALEYTVRIFQPFDLAAGTDTVMNNLAQMHDTTVSSHDWNEDAIAGLWAGVNELDWTPFQTRLLFLITDAGSLDSDDPAAMHPNVGIINIVDAAERKHIAMFPIHLLSKGSEGAGITPRARSQWIELGAGGDVGRNKYLPVPAASVQRFDQEMTEVETRLIDAIVTTARGTALQRPALPEDPGLGDLVLNELFSAQVRYVGALRGTAAPRILRAWAADKDLTDPRRPGMLVRVFLTRNQLSNLARQLKDIVERAKASQMSADTFFNELRSLAAATAQDPARHGERFASIAESNLLPAYLKLLPYRSEVLAMTEQRYRDMGFTEQQRFISRLEAKLQGYADIDASADRWIDLGDGDPGQKVIPLPMALLP